MAHSHDHGHDHEHEHDFPHPGHDAGPPGDGGADVAQQSLVGALRSSFRVLRIIMVVLVVLYALSGVFRVDSGEQGLLVRFGKLVTNTTAGSPLQGTPVFEEGWHAALPDPFDEKIALPTRRYELVVNSFLFKVAPENATRPLSEIIPTATNIQPGQDGAMFSGDRNLSHGRWKVLYSVADAENYARNVGETPDAVIPILQRLTEEAVVREASYRRVEEILAKEIDLLAGAVKERLQESIDAHALGVKIDQVSAETIEPANVKAAFDSVVQAENEKRRLEDEARAEATRMLNAAAGPRHRVLLDAVNAYGAAQLASADETKLGELRGTIAAELEHVEGQAKVAIDNAESQANQVGQKIQREFEQFAYYLDQYRKNPRLTSLGLWTQMREEILSNIENEIVYLSHDDEIELVVGSDPVRRTEAERRRLEQLRRGGGNPQGPPPTGASAQP